MADSTDQSAMQMVLAPKRAVFVAPSQDHVPFRELALQMCRPDLDVVKLSWLRNSLNWLGRTDLRVVVDSAAHQFLDAKEIHNLRELQALGLLADSNLGEQ